MKLILHFLPFALNVGQIKAWFEVPLLGGNVSNCRDGKEVSTVSSKELGGDYTLKSQCVDRDLCNSEQKIKDLTRI